MTILRAFLKITLAVIALSGPAASANAAEPRSEHDRLSALFGDYREAWLKLNPLSAMFDGDYRYNNVLGNDISPEYLAQSQALEQEYVGKLAEIKYDALDEQDRLSFDIFKYDRDTALEGYREGYARMDSLMPMNQFYSLPSTLAQFGGGTSAQPFATVEDYDNWLQRIGGFPAWVGQAITNMRRGIEQGVVLPRVVVERMIPQFGALMSDDAGNSVFYGPVKSFPKSFSDADKARLTAAYEKSIREVIAPAYRQLHDFLEQEYLPKARATVGLGQLPNGGKWYAYLARYHTTTTLSPEEIHRIGLEQVRRITADMEAVKKQVGFSGDLPAFFRYLRTDPKFFQSSPEALLNSYRDLKKQMDAALPREFDLKPKADFIVEPMEAFRQASGPTAEYLQPAPDGTRPGLFYVNTYKLDSRPIWEREALFMHEAEPGHHFQISIAQEQDRLPKFRRFDGPTAFVEGWGLYAETLGYELGFYKDPYQRMGALSMQIWRADRLVVDTGMHAMGWTREQAVDFMKSNTPKSEQDIAAEVERYIAIPGQALAYKIGQIKLTELRQRVEGALGPKFDVRAFHHEVLADGAMPLALLERKINRWIDTQKPR